MPNSAAAVRAVAPALYSLVVCTACVASHIAPDGPAMGPEVETDSAQLAPCPTALHGSAPAPMPGYGLTRSGRSDFELPGSAPLLSWELDLPQEADRDAPMVVAPEGRLYVPVGASRLVAVDDGASEGRLAWNLDLEGPYTGPVLLEDGTLLLMRRPSAEVREAVWLTPGGEIRRRVALPTKVYGPPLVDVSGSMYFTAEVGDNYETELLALRCDGTVRWRSPPLSGRPVVPALGHGGHILMTDRVVNEQGSEAWLLALDSASGETAFRTLLDADATIVGGPGVGDDGAIHVVLWTEGHRRTALVVLGPEGTLRYRVELPEEPWGGGTSSLSVGADGVVYVKEGQSVMAVSEQEVLWQREAHPNADEVGVIDARGWLLVGGGAANAVDGRDGSTRWSAAVAAYEESLPGGGVAIHFPGPATLGDRVLYFMASERRLRAASAP